MLVNDSLHRFCVYNRWCRRGSIWWGWKEVLEDMWVFWMREWGMNLWGNDINKWAVRNDKLELMTSGIWEVKYLYAWYGNACEYERGRVWESTDRTGRIHTTRFNNFTRAIMHVLVSQQYCFSSDTKACVHSNCGGWNYFKVYQLPCAWPCASKQINTFWAKFWPEYAWDTSTSCALRSITTTQHNQHGWGGGCGFSC